MTRFEQAVTGVAVVRRVGMLRKHTADTESWIKILQEKLMLPEQVRPMPPVRGPELEQRPAESWYASVSAAVMTLLAEVEEAYARHLAVAELQSLDDRMLRDIGLSRGEIRSALSRKTTRE
jgi:uncharacterized protein YjiS (DUF1127 family)